MNELHDELKIQDILDMDVWQKIQDSFAESTGFAAIIVDKEGKPLLNYSNFSDYCLKVRKSPFCTNCFLSDAKGGNEASKAEKPIIYQCHAGLIDFAVPIMVDGKYLGAILAGQARPNPDDPKFLKPGLIQTFHESNKERVLSSDEELKELYYEIQMTDYDRLIAASDLLYTIANHLAEMKIVNQIQTQLHEKEIQLTKEKQLRSEVEASLKEADLKALQSQVNPHFLFNVLNTIGRLASLEEAGKTEEIVYQFADLMRYSLKRNDNYVVTIRDELDYVQNYLSIQKIRLGERLWYQINCDPEDAKTPCPSMIIQPFVENVINYVIEPRIAGGKIRIDVSNNDGIIEISITDNGQGIPEETVQQILSGTYNTDGKSTGLGIVNVNKRLKYYYGPEFGVRIENPEGMGTRVLIRIPTHNIEL